MPPKHIFCQCMKPWKICTSKQKSYQIDIRDLLTTYDMPRFITKFHLNYDFINKKFQNTKFICRYNDCNNDNNGNSNNGSK